MARLPSEKYLIQQVGGVVILFEDFTEREIARFDSGNQDATAKAQQVISGSELGEEDRCFAHFWSGYFSSYNGHPAPAGGPVTYDKPSDLVGVFGEDNHRAVVTFDPRDQNAAAKAQAAIHFSDALSEDAKRAAHFWSGYFYGLAS
jgi:hypothetical protein